MAENEGLAFEERNRGRQVVWTKREAVEMAETLLDEDETEVGDWVQTARTLLEVLSMMVAEDMDRTFSRKPNR